MNELIKAGQAHGENFTGYSVEKDGVWGTDTQSLAIRCVQQACNKDYNAGLELDGVWGVASSDALRGHYVKKGETQALATALEICLLLRGYDPNGVESPGVFGSGLWSAVTCFQSDNGLAVDGIAGENTFCKLIGVEMKEGDSGEWKKYDPNNLPNFGPDEFKCQCGCGHDVCDELKQKAQLLRDKIGMAMTITDGFRCEYWNQHEGGTSTSLHKEGKAFDMQVFKNGTYHMTDDDQRYYRELAHKCGLTTGNYYGSGGGWMHCQIGRNDYDENY